MNHASQRSARAGFSLIEVLFATATIGIGVTALMTAVAASTRVNGEGRQITQAAFLAQELREWTVKLPFVDPDEGQGSNPPGSDGSSPQIFVDDLDDLMDVTYSPPRDGQGQPITDMADWSQTIVLTWRDPDSIATQVAAGTSDVVHVELTVSHHGRDILKTGWLVADREDN